MIVSFDSIMKPPYALTSGILHTIASISEKMGRISATHLDKPNPQLRKQNKIKTIQASLQIEGNTLNENQITALLEGKTIVGPAKDITEVKNALSLYATIHSYNYKSEKDFLKAHSILMKNLVNKSGFYRTQGVGVVDGSKVKHLAPPADRINFLMTNLFTYLKNDDAHYLIKSCVFHYELEFIHPFLDGNGRMGRFWQTLILSTYHPLFDFLPFDTLISENQNAYYQALADSDKAGNASAFISFMLNVIDTALAAFLDVQNKPLNQAGRLAYFISTMETSFSRKEYMQIFKTISSATASRDLKFGVQEKMFSRIGKGNATVYKIIDGNKN